MQAELDKMPDELAAEQYSTQESEDNTNLRYRPLTKETLQETIAQQGNDIDLIFTGAYHSDILDHRSAKDMRDEYIKQYIPALLKQHNIPFSYEE